MPAILRWPAAIKAGVTPHQPVATVDFTATLLSAAQAKLPAGKRWFGMGIIPFRPPGP